nr:MAG TPA: hypothetical protein [Caudoviricetes sp.]
MLPQMRMRLYRDKLAEYGTRRELAELMNKEAFKKFIERACSLYAENLNVAENETLKKRVRLGAMGNLKLLDSLLDVFDNYKENEND